MKVLAGFVVVLLVFFPDCTLASASGRVKLKAIEHDSSFSPRQAMQSLTAALRGCPPLVASANVDITCTKVTNKVAEVMDCTKKVIQGTKATFKCKLGFVSTDKYKVATCSSTRKWSKPVITCKAEETTTAEATAASEAVTEEVTSSDAAPTEAAAAAAASSVSGGSTQERAP